MVLVNSNIIMKNQSSKILKTKCSRVEIRGPTLLPKQTLWNTFMLRKITLKMELLYYVWYHVCWIVEKKLWCTNYVHIKRFFVQSVHWHSRKSNRYRTGLLLKRLCNLEMLQNTVELGNISILRLQTMLFRPFPPPDYSPCLPTFLSKKKWKNHEQMRDNRQ